MRIGLIKHNIRDRNREISNSVAVNHIAEIEQTSHYHSFGIDEHVVIIRITMNNTSSQCGIEYRLYTARLWRLSANSSMMRLPFARSQWKSRCTAG